VTGHAATSDVSILWINASETWVDYVHVEKEVDRVGEDSGEQEDGEDSEFDGDQVKKSQVSFVSESGIIEFFILSSATSELRKNNAAKDVLYRLSTVTGFAPLPPIYSLGFHFSKYEQTSAEKVMYRDESFEQLQFPVDVYWLDIKHTD